MQNKSMMSILIIAVIAVIGIAGFMLLNGNDDDSMDKTNSTTQSQETSQDAAEEMNVVEIASGDDQFSTLVAAVKAAGLAETLSGTGPFTVFAPTNSAFDKLPAGTVTSLLEPANIETLKSILTYHVVPAKAMSSDLKDGQVLTTVQGGSLTVKIADGKVTLTDAKGGVSTVVKADIDAKNGVVHVIDTVVMP